jgi:hypothetical protein
VPLSNPLLVTPPLAKVGVVTALTVPVPDTELIQKGCPGALTKKV